MSNSGSEVPGIETFLYGVLAADATVQAACGGTVPRVYQGHPPEGTTAYPCVVYASQGDGPDTRIVGKYRLMSTRHYLVKAIDKAASVLGIAGLVSQLDALLDGQSGQGRLTTLYDGRNTQILSCTREHAVDYPEVTNGIEYRHLGAVYQIQAQMT